MLQEQLPLLYLQMEVNTMFLEQQPELHGYHLQPGGLRQLLVSQELLLQHRVLQTLHNPLEISFIIVHPQQQLLVVLHHQLW